MDKRFHPARWTQIPLSKDAVGLLRYCDFAKVCVVCGAVVGEHTSTRMLEEIVLIPSEDGCCEVRES